MSVEIRGPDDCWPWKEYAEDGYGQFFYEGRMFGAHELAVTFTTGERRLPKLDTCHSCGNPPCCNPAHLRFDTRQGNVDDTVRMGRNYHPAYRLTDDEVLLMRERRAAGAAQQDLAAQFGVSQGHVSMIVSGQRRAEVGGPLTPKRPYHRRKAA